MLNDKLNELLSLVISKENELVILVCTPFSYEVKLPLIFSSKLLEMGFLTYYFDLNFSLHPEHFLKFKSLKSPLMIIRFDEAKEFERILELFSFSNFGEKTALIIDSLIIGKSAIYVSGEPVSLPYTLALIKKFLIHEGRFVLMIIETKNPELSENRVLSSIASKSGKVLEVYRLNGSYEASVYRVFEESREFVGRIRFNLEF